MRKWIVVLGVVSLTSCISVKINADQAAEALFYRVSNEHISSVGTFLESGERGKGWSNENNSNSTKAYFSEASNTSAIHLEVSEAHHFNFHHKVQLQGKMVFKIMDANQKVIYARDLSDSIEETFDLKLEEGKYKVIWQVNEASGSYFLEWKEK